MNNQSQQLSTSDSAAGPLPASTGRPLLLIVDDQLSNLQLLQEVFKNDYEVCTVTGGQATIAFCQTRSPDLILLDVLMPDLDGYETCQRLKNDVLTKNIPVIFVTVKDDQSAEARGLEVGGVDFISKPFHLRALKARVRTHLMLKRQADQLRSLAMLDGLTGVGNRRRFDLSLESEWLRCVRGGQPLSLILCDVDFFKRYNDCYGHQAGDACLQAITGVLREVFTRTHDLVARYGGEEFVCILPDTPLNAAETLAKVLEQAVRKLGLQHQESDVCDLVTISVGVATAYPAKGETAAALVACADEQMYLAKQAGRGRVISSECPRKAPEPQ